MLVVELLERLLGLRLVSVDLLLRGSRGLLLSKPHKRAQLGRWPLQDESGGYERRAGLAKADTCWRPSPGCRTGRHILGHVRLAGWQSASDDRLPAIIADHLDVGLVGCRLVGLAGCRLVDLGLLGRGSADAGGRLGWRMAGWLEWGLAVGGLAVAAVVGCGLQSLLELEPILLVPLLELLFNDVPALDADQVLDDFSSLQDGTQGVGGSALVDAKGE